MTKSITSRWLVAATVTRPDISQLYQSSTPAHFTAVKILRYLKGTITLGLVYKKSSDNSLYGYSDADWVGDIDSCHSTTSNVFVMSDAKVSWLSKKQQLLPCQLLKQSTLLCVQLFKKPLGSEGC